jgi:hypothetical protein
VLADQRAEINVYRPSKPVPAREPIFLCSIEVRERVRDALEIDPNTAFRKSRPFTAPVSEKMAVRALACLMAILAAEGFVLRRLRIRRSNKNARAEPQKNKQSSRSSLHAAAIR